jgi:hypothetical protein
VDDNEGNTEKRFTIIDTLQATGALLHLALWLSFQDPDASRFSSCAAPLEKRLGDRPR